MLYNNLLYNYLFYIRNLNNVKKIYEEYEINLRENEKIMNNEENSVNDDTFIKLAPMDDLLEPIDKSQLVEYDKFYKELFFKNEVFHYDVDNIQDKEITQINKEMTKLDIKRRLTEKKKLKEVNALKGKEIE